jgi:hypothetical protein
MPKKSDISHTVIIGLLLLVVAIQIYQLVNRKDSYKGPLPATAVACKTAGKACTSSNQCCQNARPCSNGVCR